MESETKTATRGFASMDAHKQKEIARKGGKAAHEKGTAHEFTTDEARAAGRKGGERVSANREHMSRIGRIGGKSSAGKRQNSAATSSAHPGQESATHASPQGEGHADNASHAHPQSHAHPTTGSASAD